MAQNNVIIYGKAFQNKLETLLSPIPVYAAFNRNFASQPKFITWNLRNVHQPVYTGQLQNNKGIDTPVFQVSIFTQVIEDGFTISNQILQSLHGYSGVYGTGGDAMQVSKTDIVWLYNSYDNTEKLAQVFLDCTLYIQT